MQRLILIAICCCASHAAEAPKVARLSMAEAIQLALGADITAIQLAQKGVATARGGVTEARSATSVMAQTVLAERVFRVDLRSLGIDLPKFSDLISSTNFSGTRGPYALLDPRIQAAKTLIDRNAARKVAAASKGIEEAQSVVAEEREAIAAETARAYLEAARATETAELANRNVRMAETMLDFATERRKSGLAGDSEVRHARVQINSEQQKASAAKLAQNRAVLRLLYLLGGSFGDSLELTTSLSRRDAEMGVEDAVAKALRNNPRLKTLHLGEERLKLTRDAVNAAWLPVLSTYGDFGMPLVTPSPSGSGLATHSLTFTASIDLKIPILDGHRRELARASVLSQLHEQDLKQRELRRQLEFNVRITYAALTDAARQADLAEANVREAEADLEEIRANRAAGNSSGVDLQEADERRAGASDARDAAYYAQAQARLTLAEAMGTVTSLEW